MSRGRLTGLALACHPAPTLAVTAVATALAAGAGHGPGGAALVGLAVLTGQVSIGWCNDALDAGRDLASGRRDKPVAAGTLPARAVATAAAAAAVACVPVSLALGLLAGLVHLTAVASAWAYNVTLKRSPLSPLPYAVSFGLLPAVATLGLPGHPWPPWWAMTASALLGTAAHAANVAPDVADDLATGVRGLPQQLGAQGARVLASALLAAATGVLVLGPPGRPDAAGLAGLVGAAALGLAGTGVRSSERSRVPFLAIVAVALVDVALLVSRGTALA